MKFSPFDGRARALLALASAALLAAPLTGQVVAEGYNAQELVFPGQWAIDTLPDGSLVGFNGTHVFRGEEGSQIFEILSVFPRFVFPSFLETAPDLSSVVLGESSSGNIWRVNLETGERHRIINVPFNFDAVFADPDRLFVSAAPCSFGCGNEIFEVDLLAGTRRLVAQVPGPSGPLDFLPNGDLLYATISDSFPAQPDATDLIAWTAAQLALGPVLQASDAYVFAAGFQGAFDFTIDADSGEVFLAENDFRTGENRLLRVAPLAVDSEELFIGPVFHTITKLEFVPGDGQARLRPFQPGDRAGSLIFTSTDFFSSWDRRRLHAQRPVATIQGPGVGGVGAIEYSIEHGPRHGFMLFYYGLAGAYQAPEVGYSFSFAEAPLFLGLSPSSLRGVPLAIVSTDGQGRGSSNLVNPVGPGQLVFYGLAYNDSVILGTSNPVFP